jgi:hypothetical protein
MLGDVPALVPQREIEQPGHVPGDDRHGLERGRDERVGEYSP